MEASVIENLPKMVGLARDSEKVIVASFILSFLYNLVGLTLAVQGLLSPVICAILMPLSSISVVVFTTLAINYLAIKKGIINYWIWK